MGNNTIVIDRVDELEPINMLLDELNIKKRTAFVNKTTGYFTLFKPRDTDISGYNIELTLSGKDENILYLNEILDKRSKNIDLLEKCYKL